MAIVKAHIGPVIVTRFDFPHLLGISGSALGWIGSPILGSHVCKPPTIVSTFQIDGATNDNGAEVAEMATNALRRNAAT